MGGKRGRLRLDHVQKNISVLKRKKMNRMLWLKITLLTVLTIGAFAYLMQELDRPHGMVEGEAASGAKTPPAPSAGVQPRQDDADKPPAVNENEQANIAPDNDKAADRVNMSFVGDVMFAGKVEALLKQHGYDYPFKYVRSYLEKADIAVANLETPITTRGTPEDKTYAYRSSPLALSELRKAGVDLVNLANNHSMDYGVEGLLDTLDYLDAEGIRRVGAGRDSEEAYRHVIMEHNGMNIAFLGFSRVIHSASWYAGKNKPGLAETYTTKLPLQAIAKAREEADLVVVIAHWEKNEITDRSRCKPIWPDSISIKVRIWLSRAIRMYCRASSSIRASGLRTASATLFLRPTKIRLRGKV